MAGPDDPRNPNSPSQFDSNNYLTRLGLNSGASDADIKAAYRSLAKELHPDRNPNDPTAEARFKQINEAYEQIRQYGIYSKREERFGQREPRERRPRSPETEAIRKRFEEVKIEALDVENFQEGGALAKKISKEFEGSDRREELLGILTRRLQHLLQRRIKEHTNLQSLATLAKEVNEFSDSESGKLLFTSFFTDELDVTALNFGLDMLATTRTKQEVDQALAKIAAYPVTFDAIIKIPVEVSKEDAIDKIKLLKKVKEGRPRTGERLDKLVEEVNAFQFKDEKRADVYKKQIIDVIEGHRRIYYKDGVFVPLRNLGQNPLRDSEG